MRSLLLRNVLVVSCVTFIGALSPAAAVLQGRALVALRADPAIFSPNNSGTQDTTFFYPVVSLNEQVTRWRLDITTERGKRVRRLGGAGFSSLISWDGRTRKGRVARDGVYRAVFTIWAGRSRMSSSPVEVVLDTRPPAVSLSVSTSVATNDVLREPFVFTPLYQDASLSAWWQFQVVDPEGRNVHVVWSTGAVRAVPWDGRNRDTGVLAPSGPYRAVFQAWDMAGNPSGLAMADVTLDVSARVMLEETLVRLQVFETPMGLLAQIPTAVVFRLVDGRPVLRPEGEALLREAGLLVNAYPAPAVRIDGYARALPAATQDRDRGSLFAWSVYSYLVKEANVKASRLTVRGRGRSAPFDRRAVEPPVPQDAVEILLEGDGPWD